MPQSCLPYYMYVKPELCWRDIYRSKSASLCNDMSERWMEKQRWMLDKVMNEHEVGSRIDGSAIRSGDKADRVGKDDIYQMYIIYYKLKIFPVIHSFGKELYMYDLLIDQLFPSWETSNQMQLIHMCIALLGHTRKPAVWLYCHTYVCIGSIETTMQCIETTQCMCEAMNRSPPMTRLVLK